MLYGMHGPSAPTPRGRDDGARRLIGIDAGKVTTSLAWGHTGHDGSLIVEGTSAARHFGEPLAPFFSLYRALGPARLAGVVAAGAFGDRLTTPALAGIPEEIAQEWAVRMLYGDAGPLNVVRIGGSGYSVLTRDAAGRIGYETNERCSAGTGETVEGLCARLGCGLDEAIALAAGAESGITVTSRCAVFAKSELTHFANQGEDHGRLFRGLFESVARNVHALYDRAKVDGPVVLVGHGALIGPLVESFCALVPGSVEVSPRAGVFEALGALRVAASRSWDGVAWPQRPEALVVARRGRVRALPPAGDGPGSVVQLLDDDGPAPRTGPAAARTIAGSAAVGTASVVLGLDLGSTGSKGVLVDPASGAVLADVYRRTDGNPVEAAKRLVADLRVARPRDEVVAVGLTGSGRDAVATVMRAAYPDLDGRLTVLNEIVAHAAAAVRFDADGGRSLSIVEIGGQDAKFINVRDGRVLESDMNRVCSAGTGSFLEEQALAHGLDDIAEFGALAVRSQSPPDLGQTCTVFVADVAAEALADGFTPSDIFAGLQYSVIKNYIGRVMGDRRFLDRVFFQGKPATNPSLARTLAAVTGREVVVPPNPGAMGALGIALLAGEAAVVGEAAVATAPGEASEAGEGGGVGHDAAPVDLEVFASARVVERRSGRCGDRNCANLCRLETAIVEVAGERRRVISGGNCPKYDARSEVGAKLPKDAPNPYRERDELVTGLLDEAARGAAAAGPLAGRRIGLPQAHYLIDTLPFFAAFLGALGAEVEVLRPTIETLALGDRRCAAPGACAPVKIAHGLTEAAGVAPLDVLFAPAFINLPSHGAAGTYTCPIAQGTPQMLDHALAFDPSAPPVVRPVLFAAKADGFAGAEPLRELEEAARMLGVSDPAVVRAAQTDACAVWERYERGLREIGVRALAFARAQGVPVVLVVGEVHVVHDKVINSGIHDLIAANGAVPLPLDCFPVDEAAPALRCVHWAGAGETLRAALTAATAGDVFPLLLCAYGCGPNSLVEHLFDDLLADYPHTVLESDGHGGSAGYVTRVQAFLYAVRGYREAHAVAGAGAHDAPGNDDAASAASPVDPHRLERCERPVGLSLRNNRERTFLFGNIGGSGGRFAAAAMRGAGLDARSVGLTSPAALDKARQGCSGKECLPYQLIWGTLADYLERAGDTVADGGLVFVSIGRGFQACRANLFPVAQQIQLERLGYDGAVELADFSMLFEDWSLTSAVWVGSAAADLLNMMRFYHYATEPRRGASDALYHTYADRLEALLAAPRLTGKVKGLGDARALLSRCEALVAEAAREFAALSTVGRPGDDLRTVFLCGDIYLRVDEWGNDELQRKLADQGLRVIFEPFGEIFELLALRDARDHGLTTRLGSKRVATLKFMRYVVKRLLAAARPHEPWVFWHEVGDVWKASEPLFDGYPFGESIPTIGGALLSWATQPVDGVVVVSPRGCGPALVSEAQLRRGAGFPLLFVYNDGDPIDEARLAGFAWRLRARQARLVGA
jgi:activator of 2-hydroxyglutaryl-CoA dehydratase/predicted nucleotide-binding protein (sugar kinase/HSP70/actin superfamily)